MNLSALSENFYEDLDGKITSVRIRSSSFELIFSCDNWENPSIRRLFRISLNGVSESDISPGDIGSMIPISNHPLLWKYSQEHYGIYFSSAPESPLEVIGSLFEIHEKLYGGWRPLSDYLNANARILSGGNGLLIEGPRTAIDAYSKAISDKIKHTIVPTWTPNRTLRALIVDDMFAIFDEASVEEIGSDA